MTSLLRVKKVGVFASLQDRGRYGYRAYGVPCSGPMDRASFHFGNEILSNEANAVALELFIGGFTFEALTTQSYVLTGAPGICSVNGEVLQQWATFTLKEGDVLSVQTTISGAIVYLCTAGGFETTSVLGSKSAYFPAGIGEEINDGTILFGECSTRLQNKRGLYHTYLPSFTERNVRVYKGVHFDLFSQESINAFFTDDYQFTGGNRMGYYFNGNKLALKAPKEILSEATQFGTIQVPASGQPIVLMADAQTVGGYPIIATIHPDDLRLVAQLKMYEKIRFVPI